MKEPIWILDEVVDAVHSIQLSEHGGGRGIRDKGLLASALTRPKQKFSYDPTASLFDLATAYGFGLAKKHPFVDGNKRTSFTIGTLFLELNGYRLEATEVDATITFVGVASSSLSEEVLSVSFEKQCVGI